MTSQYTSALGVRTHLIGLNRTKSERIRVFNQLLIHCSMFKLRRNTGVSILAGIVFAIGWWFIIDASCQYSRSIEFKKSFHFIGIVATIALLLTNSISNSQIRTDALNKNCLGVFGARLFLFFSFLLLFGSLIASAWVLFGYCISSKRSTFYPGLAIFIQNLAIFISALLLKLARKDDID